MQFYQIFLLYGRITLRLCCLSPSIPLVEYNNFKLKAKWLINDEFFYLVKDIFSNFIKASDAYQLTRKVQILKNSIKFG